MLSLFLGSSSVDSSPVKPPPASDWLTELSDAEETLVNSASESEADTPQPAPTFFRSFIFSPEVPIRLDYQGKRVDMEQVKLCVAFSTTFRESDRYKWRVHATALISYTCKSIAVYAFENVFASCPSFSLASISWMGIVKAD